MTNQIFFLFVFCLFKRCLKKSFGHGEASGIFISWYLVSLLVCFSDKLIYFCRGRSQDKKPFDPITCVFSDGVKYDVGHIFAGDYQAKGRVGRLSFRQIIVREHATE